jgi:hypothetical protein
MSPRARALHVGRRPATRALGVLGAAALVGGLCAAPLAAQAAGGGGVRVQVGGASQGAVASELEEVALRFGQAMGQGNVEGMSRLMADGGIRLRLGGLDRSALSSRQAQAALREFLRGYEPGTVRLVRAAPVVGSPGRGFAELRWQTRVLGTSQSAAHSLFLGLVEAGNGWRVDELRLLP